MRRSFAILLFLALPAAALRAAPPEVPKELKAEPGQLVRIVAKGDKLGTGKNFTDGEAFFDQLVSKPGEQRYVFQSAKSGVYVVGFVTIGESDIVFCTITVAAPTPADPLRARLKSAFDKSAGSPAEKAEWAKDLAALYRQAARLSADASVTSAAALKQKLKDASAALVGAEALKEVRQAVALELATVLPGTETDLTDDQRAAAAALFLRLAVILDSLPGA
jgi:hypothetical protein